jgi:hypothetical protein
LWVWRRHRRRAKTCEGPFVTGRTSSNSIAFVLDCHVWLNNTERVTARNVSASTVDLATAPLAVQVVKRRLP